MGEGRKVKYISETSLLSEWDWEKNKETLPTETMVSSQKKVWWVCAKGHSWCSSVASRFYNHHGCPYCSGNKVIAGVNDLATLKPEMAAYWDTSKNKLLPQNYSVSSGRVVWWICADCGKSFSRRIAGMHKPYCRECGAFHKNIKKEDSLGFLYPNFLEEWDWEKNTVSPYNIKPKSNKEIFWICKKFF